jgi:hypothetical protein
MLTRNLSSTLNTEYAENDIFPPTDIVEDWLKLIDLHSDNVVKVSPGQGNGKPARMNALTLRHAHTVPAILANVALKVTSQ